MFIETTRPLSNGRRWVVRWAKHLNQTYQYWTHASLRNGGCGRGVSGRILTRHRRRSGIKLTRQLQNPHFYSSWVTISSTGVTYNGRIPVMYLLDRFRNTYFSRLVSGLTYGDRLEMFPLLPEWEAFDYSGTKTSLLSLWPGMVCCDVTTKRDRFKISSSAGSYCSVIDNNPELGLVTLLLPSGVEKNLRNTSVCIVGRVAHEKHNTTVLGKAGKSFLLGWRPTVRGVAMNPIDHPHGGRTKTNSPEKSPWGWIAKFNK